MKKISLKKINNLPKSEQLEFYQALIKRRWTIIIMDTIVFLIGFWFVLSQNGFFTIAAIILLALNLATDFPMLVHSYHSVDKLSYEIQNKEGEKDE